MSNFTKRVGICGQRNCPISKCSHEKLNYICSWCGEPRRFHDIQEHEFKTCAYKPKNIDETLCSKQIFIIGFENKNDERWFKIFRSIIFSIDPLALIFRLPFQLYSQTSVQEVIHSVKWRNWSLKFIFIGAQDLYHKIAIQSTNIIVHKNDETILDNPRFNPLNIESIRFCFRSSLKHDFDLNFLIYLDRPKFNGLDTKEWKFFWTWCKKAIQRRYRMKPLESEQQKGRLHKLCCYCQKKLSNTQIYIHELTCKFRYSETQTPKMIILLITIGNDALERSRIFGTAFATSEMNRKEALLSTLFFEKFDLDEINKAISKCEALESAYDLKGRVMLYFFMDAIELYTKTDFNMFYPFHKLNQLYPEHIQLIFYSIRVGINQSWNETLKMITSNTMPDKVSVSLFVHPFDYIRTIPLMIEMSASFDKDLDSYYSDLTLKTNAKYPTDFDRLQKLVEFPLDHFIEWKKQVSASKSIKPKDYFQDFQRFCGPESKIFITITIFRECYSMHQIIDIDLDFPPMIFPRKTHVNSIESIE